jgi:hypothetical protein
MSIFPDPIKATEAAADRLIDEIEQDAPATAANIVRALLGVLAGHELVIRVSLEKKP